MHVNMNHKGTCYAKDVLMSQEILEGHSFLAKIPYKLWQAWEEIERNGEWGDGGGSVRRREGRAGLPSERHHGVTIMHIGAMPSAQPCAGLLLF